MNPAFGNLRRDDHRGWRKGRVGTLRMLLLKEDGVGLVGVGDAAWLSGVEEGDELKGEPRLRVGRFGCSGLWCGLLGGRGRGFGRRGICGKKGRDG